MSLSPASRRLVVPAFTSLLGAGMFLLPFASPASADKLERHFTVKGRPIVMIQNVADGRIRCAAPEPLADERDDRIEHE